MGFHVAIIPDGNRRWARAHGLPHTSGHEAGSRVLESLISTDAFREIDWLTLWGASVDNLTKRPGEEVAFLNALFAVRLQELAEHRLIHEQRVRVLVLGEWMAYLAPAVQAAATEVMAATAHYRNRTLSLLLAYDGLRDMIAAVSHLVAAARHGSVPAVIADALKARLSTRELPPVDLLIRTGGEPHLSGGFLMWEAANAQLMFTDRLWPEFTGHELATAVAEYRLRQRRLGA